MSERRYIWIAKHNGTIQCEDVAPSPIEVDRELLVKLIGEENVLGEGTGVVAMPRQCGLPTGKVNGFKVTWTGWQMLSIGVVGNPGFFLWVGPDESARIAESEIQSVQSLIGVPSGSHPVLVRELIGHPVRAYQKGDALTEDFIPNRVNIEVNEGFISEIWFG